MPPLLADVFAGLAVLLALAAALLVWRQRARSERRARNLRALFEVSRQATANLESQQVLEVVVQAVQDVMGYRMASILLRLPSEPVLVSSAISTNLRDRIPLGDRVPLGRGMVGECAVSGLTQLANDITRNRHYIRAPGGWDPGSELCVPLKAGGQILGVLDVEDERRGVFGPDDVQVLEALADQLVVILSKARLLESERRRADRIATLNAVGRLINTSLSADALLSTAVAAIERDLRYPDIAVLLVDPDQPEVLVLRAAGGIYRQVSKLGEYRQALTQGLIGRAGRQRQTVRVNQIGQDPDYLPVPFGSLRPVQAELAVPIVIGDRLLGVLNVEGAEPFTDDDATGFEIIADQLAIALENARLFAGTEANLAQLRTLYELSQRLSQAQTSRALMRAALEVLAEHSPYRCTVAFYQFDATGHPKCFYVPFFYQPGRGIVDAELYIPTSDDALNPLLDAGETVAIGHVAHDPRVPAFLRDDQIASGRPSLALIPLVAGGRRIGNLVLSHTEAHTWTETELRLFRSAANQIAAALDNARRLNLEQDRTERLALIARVGQGIAARLDPDELLATTVQALHSRLGYAHVSIFLLDPADEGWLVQRARASRWPRGESTGYRQLATQGIMGAAAQSRRPEVVNAVLADPRYIAVPGSAIRAELAVPILLGDRLLGIIDVAGADPFGEDDLTGLLIVSDQLGVALENAMLYERAQTAGVLEERQRLARDLHDSVTQLVFSLTLIAQSVGSAYRRDAVEGERRIGRMLELSQQALAEMRALLTELRPAGPVPNGLLPALQKHIERVAARERLSIALEAASYAAQPVAPTREHEEALYRIVQEALNNVVKHARAGQVTINLGRDPVGLTLTIADDGQGFDPGAPLPPEPRAGGFGLVGMRERAERLGGAFSLTSAPGAGTTLHVVLPNGA